MGLMRTVRTKYQQRLSGVDRMSSLPDMVFLQGGKTTRENFLPYVGKEDHDLLVSDGWEHHRCDGIKDRSTSSDTYIKGDKEVFFSPLGVVKTRRKWGHGEFWVREDLHYSDTGS